MLQCPLMLITAHPVYQKITWRLIPVLFTCYVLAYLDRVNVGFAKLSMKEEPWFSEAVFATGSGIFFIGYFLEPILPSSPFNNFCIFFS